MTLQELCKTGFLSAGDVVNWHKGGVLRTATVRHTSTGWVLLTIDSSEPLKSWNAWITAVGVTNYGELPKHSCIMRGDGSIENLQAIRIRALDAAWARAHPAS